VPPNQLKRAGKEGSLEYKIVHDHMQDLGKRRFPEIARRMGISVEQIQKCANNISQLDPRPDKSSPPPRKIMFFRT
jgi:RNA polymerase sigma-54 factor